MLRWVKENKKEGKPYHFTILLHTLKGFDGVFIIDALYKMNLKVTDIMATGTKMLHFKHKQPDFQRFPLLPEYATDQFYQDVWIERAEKRLVSTQVFQVRKFGL